MNDHDVTVVLERLIEPLDDEVGSWDDVLRRAAEPRPEYWDDVLDRAGPAAGRRLTLEHSLARRSRRRLLVLVTAALVVVVVTASAFGTVRDLFVVEATPYARGTLTRTVDGIRFTLRVPPTRWENGPHEQVGGKLRTHSLLISKSTVGPQGAEAVIFWTAFPDGGEADPCRDLRRPGIRSAADLAAAVASAPGTKLVQGSSRVTVGGRPATHVVVTVRRDLGCDPGFFFTWRQQTWGAFWPGTDVGDTIKLWIVDVRGKLLVIEAETKPHDWALLSNELAREIENIVESIRFE